MSVTPPYDFRPLSKNSGVSQSLGEEDSWTKIIDALQQITNRTRRPILVGKSAKDQLWQRASGPAFSAPLYWLTSLLLNADTILH